LTGCDSTSSLFGIEEKAAYQALSKKVTTGNALAGLRNANVLESWMEAAIELVLAMYRKRAKACKTLDEIRYLLATTSDKPATQLPPTEDAFWQHALRAHLQTLIWTQTHIAKPNIPDPDGHGVFTAADDKQVTVLIGLDLSAAFDTVDHRLLLDRLRLEFGVTEIPLRWLQSYINYRRSIHYYSVRCL